MTTLADLITDPCIGLDTARWQGEAVPFAACVPLGVRWAVIKWWHAQWRGDAPTQRAAQRQYDDARAAGLLVGRYAWWLPEQPIAAQVAAWTSTPWADEDLPLTIDVEEPGSGIVLASLEDLVRRVEDATGRAPIIYSGAWWADARLGPVSEVLRRCPYWHAAYPRKAAKGTAYREAMAEWLAQPAPTLPRIWQGVRPVAWQLDGTDDASGTGALRLPNGVDVDVDLGDWSALTALVPAYHRPTDPGLAWSPTEPPPALQIVPEEQATVHGVLDMVAGPPPAPSVTQPGTPTAIRRSSSSSLRALRPPTEDPEP